MVNKWTATHPAYTNVKYCEPGLRTTILYYALMALNAYIRLRSNYKPKKNKLSSENNASRVTNKDFSDGGDCWNQNLMGKSIKVNP